MMEPNHVDAPSSTGQRALDFRLAALLASYPEPSHVAHVENMRAAGAGGDARLDAMWAYFAREPQLTELATDYCGLFLLGEQRTPLYETEYGRMRGMSKGNDLADIAGFYRAFGLQSAETDADKEMLDHFSVELEFYAFLLAKEDALDEAAEADGVAVVRDARRAFLVDHLGRLATALRGRAAVHGHAVYDGVFSWATDLVAAECSVLAVEPSLLDYFADTELEQPTQCQEVGEENAPAARTGLPILSSFP
jgi:TorA maturation chaperone TorD